MITLQTITEMIAEGEEARNTALRHNDEKVSQYYAGYNNALRLIRDRIE